jgi:Uma2 family endonuclease
MPQERGELRMTQVQAPRATIDDLYKVDGPAELVGGRIVRQMSTGYKPSRVAGRIFRSLADHCDKTGTAEAFGDGLGYVVAELPSGRESFCPDVSYFTGPLPKNRMKFINGAPDFAVEVRSEDGYGRKAEREQAEKRADYFAAGTKVVWDVDPAGECIHAYRADAPAKPTTFRKGDTADAEPAVPGWKPAVEWVMG